MKTLLAALVALIVSASAALAGGQLTAGGRPLTGGGPRPRAYAVSPLTAGGCPSGGSIESYIYDCPTATPPYASSLVIPAVPGPATGSTSTMENIPVSALVITWPTIGDLLISNNTNSPAGLTEVDGDCVTGSGGAWITGPCGSGTGISQLTGDVTATGPGVTAATLATVNSNIGTFASVTANGKGLVTAAGNLTGDVTTSGAAATLATVNPDVGSFTSANITVDGKGRITAAASGSGGGGSPGGSNGQVQYNNSGAFGGLTNVQLTADINAFTTSLSGAAPASGGGTTNFLRADGTWAAPAGGSGGFASWPTSGTIVISPGGAGTVNPTGSAAGTGVLTALGINVGSAGAFVVNGGALGTPSGGTLTNATGLPAASVLAGALANGMTGTTQTVGDNTTKLATDAFVIANAGGGGTVTSVGLAPGFTTTIGTQNTAGQTITTTGTINAQLWPSPQTTAYTVLTSDTGALLLADGGSSFAFTLPNPASGTKGTPYQFNDETGHGYSLATAGATADFVGCSGDGGTTLAIPAKTGVSVVDTGTAYACLLYGGGGAVASVSGTAGQVTVSPTTGATVVSLPSTITANETISGNWNHTGTLQYKQAAAAPCALTDASTIAVAAGCGGVQTVTIAGNRTLGFPTGLIASTNQIMTFEVKQDGTGGRTLALASGYTPATMPLNVAANAITVFSCAMDAASSTAQCAGGQQVLPGYTIGAGAGQIPACSATTLGWRVYVTDGAATPLYNVTQSGGGSTVVPVFCDGTNWTNH